MIFRRAEMTMLEHTSTKVAARPMPMPLEAMVDVDRVGQVPRTSTNTGFSFRKPVVNTFSLLLLLISTHRLSRNLIVGLNGGVHRIDDRSAVGGGAGTGVLVRVEHAERGC